MLNFLKYMDWTVVETEIKGRYKQISNADFYAFKLNILTLKHLINKLKVRRIKKRGKTIFWSTFGKSPWKLYIRRKRDRSRKWFYLTFL